MPLMTAMGVMMIFTGIIIAGLKWGDECAQQETWLDWLIELEIIIILCISRVATVMMMTTQTEELVGMVGMGSNAFLCDFASTHAATPIEYPESIHGIGARAQQLAMMEILIGLAIIIVVVIMVVVVGEDSKDPPPTQLHIQI
jgi:hypothetical protein